MCTWRWHCSATLCTTELGIPILTVTVVTRMFCCTDVDVVYFALDPFGRLSYRGKLAELSNMLNPYQDADCFTV